MNEIDRANKDAEFHKVMSDLQDERIRIQKDTIRIQEVTIKIQTIALIFVIIINLVGIFS